MIAQRTPDFLSHLTPGCVGGGVGNRGGRSILPDSRSARGPIQPLNQMNLTMNSAKSTFLTLAGLVLCLASSASGALVPPVVRSPPNGFEIVPPNGVILDWASARSAAGYDDVVKDAQGK